MLMNTSFLTSEKKVKTCTRSQQWSHTRTSEEVKKKSLIYSNSIKSTRHFGIGLISLMPGILLTLCVVAILRLCDYHSFCVSFFLLSSLSRQNMIVIIILILTSTPYIHKYRHMYSSLHSHM